MARLGDREASMSVLERLLANAALRDEAGRLHSPAARARPPAGVSQGVWAAGCRDPWLGLPPVLGQTAWVQLPHPPGALRDG